ncbi:MAG: extracellular solute-binding protein [Litorilinea sp.]
MRQRLRFTGIALVISAALALLFISIYAVSGRSDNGNLQGRILIWHAYAGAEAEAFQEMLERFRNIHPDVTVMQQSFATADLLQAEYLNAVTTGLGPDIVLGPSSWIAPLARGGHIAPLNEDIPEDVWQRYTPATLDTVAYAEDRYAVPLAFNTLALYYNRQVVSDTLSTIDGLEREAAQGELVLMSTTFRDAYWGINAFGGNVFGEDGNVVLNQGGYANWLAWLANFRNFPGVILDNNRDALRNRFIQGDAAYYVGYASELNAITEGLGLENIDVSPLPAGPIANAQPLLEVTGFMFSPVSSGNQRGLAIELTQFLANAEQSGALMRRVRTVPANQRVRINPRLNPIVSSFATQARAAAPLLNTPEMENVLRLGGEAYLRVLDGGVPPAEAAVAITNQINEANGLGAVAQQELACTFLGTVRLIHSWEDSAADALDRLIQRFRAICPLIIVEAQYELPANISARLESNTSGISRAITVLGSQELMQSLLGEEPLIREVTPYITNELLQRFQPNALDTLRQQRALYGLPVALNLDALYYNRELTPNGPALTVDDLRAQAGQGVPIALDVNFASAFWGVSAYGGRLFDGENRVVLDQGGMAPWLEWLRESRDSFGMVLSDDTANLRSRFEAGEIAYYVGSSADLAELRESMGEETLGVATLPAGPGGNGVPLLTSQGFFISQSGTDVQISLILELIRFMTNAESQTFLAESAGSTPVNATVDVGEESPMGTFMEISRNAIARPNNIYMRTVRANGEEFYSRVLEDNEEAGAVVQTLTTAINEENGIAPLPTPEPTSLPASEPVEGDEPDSIMLEGEDPQAEGSDADTGTESDTESGATPTTTQTPPAGGTE